jgi:hypothetical protein
VKISWYYGRGSDISNYLDHVVSKSSGFMSHDHRRKICWWKVLRRKSMVDSVLVGEDYLKNVLS